eukprot:TRINITY_DN2389_c0_g1_i1.p1 TRINITY_DN2389_c0_g1~~TRINITY_DN2389_c0_g1_i1.p1  ORF type:complete len:546 (-),score=122.53 TRINITY_DN2389_c0_g1_i1:17-1531(-)
MSRARSNQNARQRSPPIAEEIKRISRQAQLAAQGNFLGVIGAPPLSRFRTPSPAAVSSDSYPATATSGPTTPVPSAAFPSLSQPAQPAIRVKPIKVVTPLSEELLALEDGYDSTTSDTYGFTYEEALNQPCYLPVDTYRLIERAARKRLEKRRARSSPHTAPEDASVLINRLLRLDQEMDEDDAAAHLNDVAATPSPTPPLRSKRTRSDPQPQPQQKKRARAATTTTTSNSTAKVTQQQQRQSGPSGDLPSPTAAAVSAAKKKAADAAAQAPHPQRQQQELVSMISDSDDSDEDIPFLKQLANIKAAATKPASKPATKPAKPPAKARGAAASSKKPAVAAKAPARAASPEPEKTPPRAASPAPVTIASQKVKPVTTARKTAKKQNVLPATPTTTAPVATVSAVTPIAKAVLSPKVNSTPASSGKTGPTAGTPLKPPPVKKGKFTAAEMSRMEQAVRQEVEETSYIDVGYMAYILSVELQRNVERVRAELDILLRKHAKADTVYE